MTVELRPLGVRCNLGCRYCYQDPQRDAEGRAAPGRGYDLSAMKAAAEREGGPFVLFGGEPLLLPLADLEELLAWGFDRHGATGLQTNGVLIADEHIRLFRRYNVAVGISMDGPGPLNDLRRQGSLARTRQATQRTWDNIRRLAAEHRAPGVIVTLHRLNAAGERLGQLISWLHTLDELGIASVRLHLLEVDDEALRAMALTVAENAAALTAVAAAAPSFARLQVDVLHDVDELMTGGSAASCTWHGCDPYSTPAVRGVEGDGSSSNCGRTNKDGINYLKAERPGYERYVTLARTPMADGGCQGCRFFLLCRGQCPGTAADGDWRNRSEHCAVWMSRFEATERDLLSRGRIPVSLDPRRAQAEQRLVAAWRRGTNLSTREVLADERPPRPPPFLLPEPGYRLVYSSAALQARWGAAVTAAQQATRRIGLVAAAAGVGGRPVTVIAPSRADAWLARQEAVALGLAVRVLNQPGEPVRLAVGPASRMPGLDGDVTVPATDRCGAASGWPDALGDGPADTSAFPNVLLRGIGLDVLGHEPCSAGCPRERVLAEQRVSAAARAGVAGLDELLEVLGWSAEWTGLHGMAEVKTPVFRAVHPTSYTSGLRRARFHGTTPAGSPAGLCFPFPPSPARPLLQIRGR
jgi:uncharacterized protein